METSNGLNSGCLPADGLHPSYGAGGGRGAGGGLNNVDGVRCWLPCLDAPSQRAVFDVTVRLVMNNNDTESMSTSNLGAGDILNHISDLSILCSGVDISDFRKDAANSFEHQTKSYWNTEVPMHKNYLTNVDVLKERRFFTAHRIPVSSLGVFVGRVNCYRALMYGSEGVNICVEEIATAASDINFVGKEIKPLAARNFQKLPNCFEYAYLGFEQATRYFQRTLGKRYPHREYTQV